MLLKDQIWLPRQLLDTIEKEGMELMPLETGGVLMGYVADNGDTVVTDIILAGPNAIHNRWKFIPDHAYQQEQINHLYHESGGVTTYLGDWHTHPGLSSAMSWRDRRTLQKIALTPSARISHPLMAILGEDGLTIWRHEAERVVRGSSVVALRVLIH